MMWEGNFKLNCAKEKLPPGKRWSNNARQKHRREGYYRSVNKNKENKDVMWGI